MAQLNPADATLDPQAKAAPPCDETQAKKAAEPKDEPDGDEEDEPDGDEPDEEKPADKKGKAKGKKASAIQLASADLASAHLASADRKEIREYCKLAGHESMALEFIGKGLSVEKVCAALTDLRAKESDSVKLTSHVNPLNDGQSVQSLDAEASQYANQNGITKEQAYAKMLQANPQVYEAFSRHHSAKALRFRLGETVSLD